MERKAAGVSDHPGLSRVRRCDSVFVCATGRDRDRHTQREKDPEWSVRETERASRRGSFVSLCAWTDII